MQAHESLGFTHEYLKMSVLLTFLMLRGAMLPALGGGLLPADLYKNIAWTETQKVGDAQCMAAYLKSNKQVDPRKTNFRLVSKDGMVRKLVVEKITETTIDELSYEKHRESRGGHVHCLWLPKQKEKCTDWYLKNEPSKGSFDLKFSRTMMSKKSLKKKREEREEHRLKRGKAESSEDSQ